MNLHFATIRFAEDQAWQAVPETVYSPEEAAAAIRPRQVTGDTIYGTTGIIVTIEDANIRASLPLPAFDHRTRVFGRDRFSYEAGRDVSRCPGGQVTTGSW